MTTLINISNKGDDYLMNMRSIADANIDSMKNQENDKLNRKITLSETAKLFIETISSVNYFDTFASANLLDCSKYNNIIKKNNNIIDIIDSDKLDEIINDIDVDVAYNENNLEEIIKGVVLIHFRYNYYDENKPNPTKESLVFSIIDKLIKCNNLWGSSQDGRNRLLNILSLLGNGSPIERIMQNFTMEDLEIYGW